MFILSFFKTILYIPLYNALVFLIHVIPGHDVGIAVILLTFFVKIVLYPFSSRSIKSQANMRAVEPEIKALRAKKLDKQAEAAAVMEIYKKNKVNPFSGCLLLLIQLPIIISLYWVFVKGLPTIDTSLLYSFTPHPESLNMMFLGIVNLKTSSIVMAILAAFTQFLQMYISLPKSEPREKGKSEKPKFQEELTRTMNTQMKYILPVFIGIIAYRFNAAVALYWTTNNIFTILQELMVRRERKIEERKKALEEKK